VEELLARGATVVILSTGFHERLQVCPETLQLLGRRNIQVQVLPTEAAGQRYNVLAASERVGALIHSTC
jgi:hypothetical protein